MKYGTLKSLGTRGGVVWRAIGLHYIPVGESVRGEIITRKEFKVMLCIVDVCTAEVEVVYTVEPL